MIPVTPDDTHAKNTDDQIQPAGVPSITQAQVEALRAKARSWSETPLHPVGHRSDCPMCNGKESMVTTNDLTHVLATPIGVREISRLPGAICTACRTELLDAAAVGIIERHQASTIHADYMTRVSRSGKVPAILVKEDLRRVLRIHTGDKLSWKVIDSDHAFVEVRRAKGNDGGEPHDHVRHT